MGMGWDGMGRSIRTGEELEEEEFEDQRGTGGCWEEGVRVEAREGDQGTFLGFEKWIRDGDGDRRGRSQKMVGSSSMHVEATKQPWKQASIKHVRLGRSLRHRLHRRGWERIGAGAV